MTDTSENEMAPLLDAVAREPGNAIHLNSVGAAYYRRHEPDAALRYFAAAIAADPRNALASENLRYVLEKLGLAPALFSNPFLHFYRQGRHYYTPLPEPAVLKARGGELFDLSRDDYAHIDLHQDAQLRLLDALAPFHDAMPFLALPETGRYRRDNNQFFEADAAVLYCMLRHHRPGRVIEIGSGYSSAVMLDARDAIRAEGGDIAFTFIDPDCSRLLPLVGDDRAGGDRAGIEIIEDLVQNIDLERFRALRAGDILFVDSSHNLKIGSDVNLILGRILPMLAEGVIIHFHDIFHNFEYPRIWLETGYPWNEAYGLKLFLMYNTAFRITFFTSFLLQRHADAMLRKLPILQQQWDSGRWLEQAWNGRRESAEISWMGGSLWLTKTGPAGF